jgi:paraquat-inducible protein B
MSKQANPTVIGGFVLGALALVVVGILVFSSGAFMRERIDMVTYFPGSVQGLTVGAQVQFQGVPIGQVTEIGLDFLSERDSFRIPVRYQVWPQQIHVIGRGSEAETRVVLQRLVDEKGLRARLESVSVVTGQYLVALNLNPQLPRRDYQTPPGGAIRVPAIAATRDRVEELLANLDIDGLINNTTDTLAAVKDVVESGAFRSVLENLNATLVQTTSLLGQAEAQLMPLTGSVEQALGDYGKLARTLDARVGPLAESMETAARDLSRLTRGLDSDLEPLTNAATTVLNDASTAMRAISSLAGEGSPTRNELDRLLAETSRAARSLRLLTDYLERHPEALIQGKR